MNIVFKGTLDRQAECRTDIRGDAVVMLSVAGTCNGWPVEAHVRFGQEYARAAEYARRTPKGAQVTIECAGATPRTDHSTAALVLRYLIRVDVRTDTECFVMPAVLR